LNLGQTLTTVARRLPDAPAISWRGQMRTYREFDARSSGFANGLAALGVHRGDRVAVSMRNRPELLEATYGCFKACYCAVPLNHRLTAGETAYHLDDSRAAAVVTDDAGAVAVLASGIPPDRVVVAGDDAPEGVQRFDELVGRSDQRNAVVEVDRDDLAWLFYTSGTTGRPKGAMLTHANLSFMITGWLADVISLDASDVTLHVAPLSHGAGFHALAAIARGAHQVISAGERFDPAEVFATLQRERVTNAWMVPTQIVLLADALAEGEAAALPHLRAIVYGGAPFAPAELERALRLFGPVLVQIYAQGETPMTATVLSAGEHRDAAAGNRSLRLASAGTARTGMDVRILDASGDEVAPGEVGEVCVRGPTVMLGYWERPDATAGTLAAGWLHTGDLGRMDEHGYLYLLDRAKDLIISGGSNVYAAEVDAVLTGHDGVRDAAVVGLADRTWGELVAAVVVADSPGDALEAALQARCEAELANYKRPRRYVFVDALPRNAHGKVLKRELREQLAQS
jgi:long-chain acyl-CoA synthetase